MRNQLFQKMQLLQSEQEILSVVAQSEKTQQFGLVLSKEEAKELILLKNYTLRKYRRVEFGESILNKIIFHFCDSGYINQDNYSDVLGKLSEIFYAFKNETVDQISDDELLSFMREQFETNAAGDVEYLMNTCLERYARAVREGKEANYEELDEEQRWDADMYMSILKELFW